MANYEEAVLSGEPKDGEKLVVNLDYGPYVTVVMPSSRVHLLDGPGDRYHYDRTKETNDGRRVYKLREATDD